jgi:DNA ligase D-like protein (predicted ligase)
MLAQPLRLPEQLGIVRGGDWIFERKLDGLRCVACRHGDEIELWSRNRLSFLGRFPEVAERLRSLPVDQFVLDGEIVAFVGEQSSFAELQSPVAQGHAVYCPFDLLSLLGRDTTPLPLHDRSDLLGRILESAGPDLAAPERVTGDPEGLLQQACRSGWEGLVAKRLSSPYRSGRSPDWRKLKCTARQEFVIGGWSEPAGTRRGFGALLVGYYHDDGLRFAGKVGTGFDQRMLRTLGTRLEQVETVVSPFVDPPKGKGVHWARPELVAEIAFSEWTPGGRLRHPSFLGLRPDKSPTAVRLERPSP